MTVLKMAAICFGPPPLPPNKKSLLSPNNSSTNSSSRKHSGVLSSTYHSFRDPAEDDEIIVIPAVNSDVDHHRHHHHQKCKKKVNHTNSLKRVRTGVKMSLLVRSHSEGNLNEKCESSESASSSSSSYSAGLTPPGTLNKCIRVLSGSWKNLLQCGMSRTPKPAATAKKVPPPAVPHEFRHSGSSFGSAGYASSEDAVFLAPTDTPGILRDDHSDYGSNVSGSAGKSPGPIFPNTTFTFPGQPPQSGGVITHKPTVYYHHQLSLQEDQGIDMTQSPGRDSPGSSSGSAGSGSRHSTASLDSGRASYHPLGGTTGRSTLGSANSPRCSLSSCSIGSEQSRVERMISLGVSDQEIIHAWLVDLHFEEYFQLFINAGYDLTTIGRMTPEDLTAIGIKKPNHRKRLKAEIAQLNLPDSLPDYIPGSLDEWLRLLRLEEYRPQLLAQGYQSVDDVTQLTWEDLEDIDIVKLGHQKKILLAIKRVKDIRAGKRFPSIDITRLHPQQDVMVHAPHGPPSPGCPPVHSTFRSFHQPWELDQTRQLTAGHGSSNTTASITNTTSYYQPMYCTDIVPIKIRGVRGKSLESLEDPTERTHHTFSPENTQTFYYQSIGWRPRSYDDGDITPTNETSLAYEGGGTLPRPRGLVRPRPVAKISAKTRETSFTDFEKPTFITTTSCGGCGNGGGNTIMMYKTLPRDFADPVKYHAQYSPHMGKKMPPSPPKRQLDSCNSNQEQTTVEVHQTSSPLPLPAYPSSDSLSISLDGGGDLPLPPPPAPSTPPHARLNPSRSWGSSEEQELINALALQHRNGSDASFKSSSSTESDSLPFANENAGTIKTRAGGRPAEYPPMKMRPGMPPHSSPIPGRPSVSQHQQQSQPTTPPQQQQQQQRPETADVLNDIGNMLANLTDELDAMLEEEKRQGLDTQ